MTICTTISFPVRPVDRGSLIRPRAFCESPTEGGSKDRGPRGPREVQAQAAPQSELFIRTIEESR